ncbi:MAG: Xaa-Pro peptidase family protein [Gammaproteobacteria bacterium]|nr:Xaa-Pro peptidase family protein [Gammaproteobacteria bacterium]
MSSDGIRFGAERDILPLFRGRTEELQRRMADDGIDLLLLTNADSIYYYTAYWGDLGLEFGRPTIVGIASGGDVTVITGECEIYMARAMTWVEDVRMYSDGVGREWRDSLDQLLGNGTNRVTLAVERSDIPAVISDYLRSEHGISDPVDAVPVIARMRMIKGPEELDMIRQAGRVAVAMGEGGRDAIAEGVPEYEVSLACIAAGTRKAAEIIDSEDPDSLMSPMIHNLQVLQSGHFTSYTHLHPRVRRLRRGDPVYMCFCAIAHFKQFKLGYDREYFVGEVKDEIARIYNTAIEAQIAAINEMRPGAIAEQVHTAADEVYRSAGFSPSYRTGRAIGYSSLEQPELKYGDRTRLEPGMVFAVDGGITVPQVFGARVGDTVIVTETGYEIATESPKELTVL